MVWYSHLLKNFPQFVVIHTVKDFGLVSKVEVDVFLNSCFATTWMNLEGIMLTEIREIMYVITNMWNLKIKTHKVYSKKNWTQMKRSTLRLYIVTLLI